MNLAELYCQNGVIIFQLTSVFPELKTSRAKEIKTKVTLEANRMINKSIYISVKIASGEVSLT